MDKTTMTVDRDAIEGDASIWQRRIYHEMYSAPFTGLQLGTMQKLRGRIAADDGAYFLQQLIDRII